MMREITKEIMEEREEQKRKGLLLPQTEPLNSAEKRSKATTKRKEVSMASARGGSEISSGEQETSEVVRTKSTASALAEGNVILHEDQSVDEEQEPVTKTKRSSKLQSLDSAVPLDIASLDDDALERMENEQQRREKQSMFKALLDMDANSQDEISIKKLISMPYKVDGEDADVLMTT